MKEHRVHWCEEHIQENPISGKIEIYFKLVDGTLIDWVSKGNEILGVIKTRDDAGDGIFKTIPIEKLSW